MEVILRRLYMVPTTHLGKYRLTKALLNDDFEGKKVLKSTKPIFYIKTIISTPLSRITSNSGGTVDVTGRSLVKNIRNNSDTLTSPPCWRRAHRAGKPLEFNVH